MVNHAFTTIENNQTQILATNKQLWKINDLASKLLDTRSGLAFDLHKETGQPIDKVAADLKVGEPIKIPMPLSKKQAHDLIRMLVNNLS